MKLRASTHDLRDQQPTGNGRRKRAHHTCQQAEPYDPALAFDIIAFRPDSHKQPGNEPGFEHIDQREWKSPDRSEPEQAGRDCTHHGEKGSGPEVLGAREGNEQRRSDCRSQPHEGQATRKTGPEDRAAGNDKKERSVGHDTHRGAHSSIRNRHERLDTVRQLIARREAYW